MEKTKRLIILENSLEKKKKQTNGKVAIRKGCPNQQCFCTGSCQEIIGWRDKLPNEH